MYKIGYLREGGAHYLSLRERCFVPFWLKFGEFDIFGLIAISAFSGQCQKREVPGTGDGGNNFHSYADHLTLVFECEEDHLYS